MRDVGFAICVVTPGDYGSIQRQGHAERISSGNCDRIEQAGGHIELSIVVVTPRPNCGCGRFDEFVESLTWRLAGYGRGIAGKPLANPGPILGIENAIEVG